MTGITRDQRDARVTNFVFLTCAASYVSNHGVGVLYVCTGCLWLIMALVYCTCVQIVYGCSWHWCIVRVYRLSMANHGVGVLYVCTGCLRLIMALVYCTCVQVVSACYHGVGVLYVCTGCLWLIMALVYCTCVQVVCG